MGQQQILGGGGNVANVNLRNQLLTRTVAVPLIHEASLLGNAYSWTAVTANIDINDTGLLVVNNSDTKWLVITRAYVRVDVAGAVKIHRPASGVTWAGTTVVGVNLNGYFANSAPASAFADESANVFAAGNVIETVYSPNATNAQVTTSFGVAIDFHDAVILAQDDAIAADLVSETGAFECTFVGYFIDSPA